MKTFNQFLDEGVLTSIGKKKPEKKAEKAMDAGARAKRKLARKVHAKYVSGSEDLVPDDIREGMVDVIKKGAKRHSKAVEKKKIKNRKAVPYAALAAHYEPEGEVLDELKTSTLRSYVNKASIDAVGRGVDAGIKGMTGPKKEMEKNMTKAYKRQRGINRAADKLASRAERNEEVVHEGDVHSGQGEKIQKRTKKWMGKQDPPMKGAPGLDAMKAREAEHRAKRGVKEEVVDEGIRKAIKKGVKIAKRVVKDAGPYDPGGYTSIGSLGNPHLGNEEKRKKERAAKRGVKEDKAYDYVVSQLKKKYGDGVLTKRDKIKPQSPAEKAKVRAHQAKVDKENAAERAKDPSQGRYSRPY